MIGILYQYQYGKMCLQVIDTQTYLFIKIKI